MSDTPASWHERRFEDGDTPTMPMSVRATTALRLWLSGVLAAVSVLFHVLSPNGQILIFSWGLIAVGTVLNRLAARFSGLVVIDTLVLTGWLSLNGGPANPFSVLYLIYVTTAAISTNARTTWLTVAASSVGFACVFSSHWPWPAALGGSHGSGHSYGVHLQGMWFAQTVTAIVVALFVRRLAEALQRSQQRRSETSQMLGLATLAAGAAHEIGNPLGTIAVAASEAERQLRLGRSADEAIDDLQLIAQEVGRAKDVLGRMAVGAGELRGEGPVSMPLDRFMIEVVDALDLGSIIRIDHAPKVMVRWPAQATQQALSQLLQNAVEASQPGQVVRFNAHISSTGIEMTIFDEGCGMTRTTLERVGEPFFTTRAGKGQGLGVFISRVLVEHMRGRMAIASMPQEGTRITIWLPQTVTE
ncbi:MAG: HAMP domain-containing sensor histidine kinase [Myxococcota bacterium]